MRSQSSNSSSSNNNNTCKESTNPKVRDDQRDQECSDQESSSCFPASPSTKHSKSKRSHTPSSEVTNGKAVKTHDDTRRSSSTSQQPTKSSSRSKPSSNPSPNLSASTRTSTMTTPTTSDPTMLDPLAFAAAAAAAAASGGLTFPYFLPSLLSQPSTSTTNAGATSNASSYPFSSLSSSLANPTAGLYPFLSPDWFTSASSMGNLTPGKYRGHLPSSEGSATLPDTKSSKKRAKSIRTLAEEHEKNASTSNASLLHSALVTLPWPDALIRKDTDRSI